MLNPRYARLLWRYLWRRYLTPPAGAGRPTARFSSAAACELQIAPRGKVRFGRFVWIGDGTKIRCHEGEVVIGAKTVIGQECTISAYRRVRIGEQCVIADRAMFIDFDHGVVEVERPIRQQGIYMRDVEVGSNVWIGYGACVLRGIRVGDNSIVGTNAVVTKDVPANAVVGGVPARVMRMREAPQTLRWPDPVEPEPLGAIVPGRDPEDRDTSAWWPRVATRRSARRRTAGASLSPTKIRVVLAVAVLDPDLLALGEAVWGVAHPPAYSGAARLAASSA